MPFTRAQQIGLITLPFLAAGLSFLFPLPYLLGICGFYLAPGLTVIKKFDTRELKRIIAFAILASIPFTLIVDYIGTINGLWFAPQSFWPRVLGVFPFEDYLWMVSAVFTILMVGNVRQEQALAEKQQKMRIRFVGAVGGVLTLLFLGGIIWQGDTLYRLQTSWLYLILGIVFFALPAFILTLKFRQLKKKDLWVIGYFFFLTLLFEGTAILHEWWIFTGTYLLKPINFFGKPLAIEELVFVGIIGPLFTLVLYRFLLKRKE